MVNKARARGQPIDPSWLDSVEMPAAAMAKKDSAAPAPTNAESESDKLHQRTLDSFDPNKREYAVSYSVALCLPISEENLQLLCFAHIFIPFFFVRVLCWVAL